MHKIRIKKQPKTGDQKDYSLVQNMVYRDGAGIGTPNVKNTMGSIDRKDANVEVEGGETVVGDVNGDGFLEHMTFVGKRHSQGGIPQNLPEGSFIFSDTKKLRIKDKELLTQVFGMGGRKTGYTPAEIAKKYQINEYVAILKDPDADPIKKRTAAEMLKNNTEMLSKLALLQESMKGFPDGIPALAESAAMALQGGAPEQGAEQPQARMGGMMHYNGGGELPKIGDVYYVNGKKVKLTKLEEDSWTDYITPNWMADPGGAYFKGEDGKTFYLNYDEFKALRNNTTIQRKGANDNSGWTGDFNRDYNFSTQPGGKIPGITASKPLANGQKLTINVGDKINTMNGSFTVINPQQTPGNDVPEQGMVGVINDKTKEKTYIHVGVLMNDINKDLATVSSLNRPTNSGKAATDFDMVEEINPAKTAQPKTSQTAASGKLKPIGDKDYTLKGRDFVYRPAKDSSGNKTWAYQQEDGKWYTVTNQTSIDRLNKHYGFDLGVPAAPKPAAAKPAATQRPAAQAAKPAPQQSGNYTDANALLNSFALGGYIPEYLMAGEVEGEDPTEPLKTTVANQQELQQKTNQRIDPNAEVLVRRDTLNGKPVTLYYKGNEKIIKDESGNIIARGPRTDRTSFEQYGSQNINQILAQNPNVRYTNTNFGTFGRQPNVKGTGIYLSSGNAQARSNNDLSPEEWKDFQDRHGDWIDKEYPGGFAKYQQDLRTSRATGDAAAAWFQDKVNEKSMKAYGVPYFAPLNGKEDSPYKRDSKFGQVTYSVPRFFDLETPPETPPQTPPGKQAYYCVEYADGTKNVVAVSYKEGEQPVAPSGGNIKNVSSAYSDKGSADGACISVQDTGIAPPPGKKPSGPWWLPDITNFVGAMTDDVNRYEPTQGKVDLQTSGYALLDPTRQIANNQEKDARTQQQIENTVDGNVGLAATLGATGESIGNSANVLGQYENANIGITNQAFDKNAQIVNQEIAANETGRVKMVEDTATLNQNMDNAESANKWKRIAAFNNGMSNWYRKKQYEQVLFPEVFIDPILGDTTVTPGFSNRNLFGPDTYSPAYAGRNAANAAGTSTGIAAWQQAYEEARGTMGDESARRYADRVAQSYIPSQSQQVNAPTARQQYNQMVQQGLVLPAPMAKGMYGGEFELPWEEI